MDCTEVTWKEEKSHFVAWEMDLPKKKKPVEFATSF